MTNFAYSSGDPGNLVGGSPASMSDISGPFADLETFLNGNIDTTNLATSAKPVTILGAYRTIEGASCTILDNIMNAAADYLIGYGPDMVTKEGGNGAAHIFYLDSTDYSVSGLTAKLRLRATVTTNATNPAATLTFGLFKVTATAGAADTMTFTIDPVVSGSTVALAPGASAQATGTSGDFSFPTSGYYAIGFSLSGAVAGGASGSLAARLELHHV